MADVEPTKIDIEPNAAGGSGIANPTDYLPYSPIQHFYNPVPDKVKIYQSEVKDRKILTDTVIFNPHTEEYISKMIEFAPLTEKLPDYWDIDKLGLGLGYGEVEGHALFSLIHVEKPTGILEIGCGHSSEYARLGYSSFSRPPRHICIEPYAAVLFQDYCVSHRIELMKQEAQSIDFRSVLDRLGPRPMVFIDTTHVLRADGELHHILINLLPIVPSGSLIHFHDIFLPWPIFHITGSAEVPHFSFAWNESILLAALLANATLFRVIHPGYFLAIEKRDLYARMIPKFMQTHQIGSAFWMKKL